MKSREPMIRKLLFACKSILVVAVIAGCTTAYARKGPGIRSSELFFASLFNIPNAVANITPSELPAKVIKTGLKPDASSSPPTAVGDSYSTNEDATLTVNASSGVLANDYSVNLGDVLNALIYTAPIHGTVTLNTDGSFTYVPN